MQAKPSKRSSPPEPAPDRLMTLTEVGERLGKTAQAMRMMIYRDEIAAVRIGKRGMRVKQSAVEAYMANLPEV